LILCGAKNFGEFVPPLDNGIVSIFWKQKHYSNCLTFDVGNFRNSALNLSAAVWSAVHMLFIRWSLVSVAVFTTYSQIFVHVCALAGIEPTHWPS
jgi:hypothetical protein